MKSNKLLKIAFQIGVVFLTIFMCGCGNKSVAGKNITVTYHDKIYNGLYTGMLSKNNPIGEGAFLANDGWSAKGTFENDLFNGTVSDFSTVLVYNDIEYEGKYTGKIQDSQISGEGTFKSDEWEYSGTFSKNTFSGLGEFKNYPYEIEYQDSIYVGKYTGKTVDFAPDGEGDFTGENNKYSFVYSGMWNDGQISGDGTLNCNGYMLSDTKGEYSGDVVDGIPCGKGNFSAENSKGYKYVYEGGFKDGTFNGEGSKIFKGDYNYSEIGNFVDGEFTPNLVDGLNAIGSKDDCQFSINEETAKFINKNLKYITGSDFKKDDVSKLINKNLTYSNYVKQPNKYQNEMVSWNGYEMIQVWIYDFFDKKDSCIEIIAQDNNNQVLRIFVIDDNLGDFHEYFAKGNTIDVIGVPLDSTSYENVSGGRTNCIIILLSWFDISY